VSGWLKGRAWGREVSRSPGWDVGVLQHYTVWVKVKVRTEIVLMKSKSLQRHLPYHLHPEETFTKTVFQIIIILKKLLQRQSSKSSSSWINIYKDSLPNHLHPEETFTKTVSKSSSSWRNFYRIHWCHLLDQFVMILCKACVEHVSQQQT